jgi:hypothetical protein
LRSTALRSIELSGTVVNARSLAKTEEQSSIFTWVPIYIELAEKISPADLQVGCGSAQKKPLVDELRKVL